MEVQVPRVWPKSEMWRWNVGARVKAQPRDFSNLKVRGAKPSRADWA
jgi:hypothetical protein